jgi:hypothetical protein
MKYVLDLGKSVCTHGSRIPMTGTFCGNQARLQDRQRTIEHEDPHAMQSPMQAHLLKQIYPTHLLSHIAHPSISYVAIQAPLILLFIYHSFAEIAPNVHTFRTSQNHFKRD